MRMVVWNAGGSTPGSGHEAGRVPRAGRAAVEVLSSRVLILDFGSQYTQLIARRVREARVYSEIHPPTRTLEWIRDWKPTGIILSGGPNSVYGDNAPTVDPRLFDVAPVLGVCYGMQLMAHVLGAEVKRGGRREYGRAEIRPTVQSALFAG